MYKIVFYQDSKGEAPVMQYLDKLAANSSKDSRIKLGKIRDYMKILELYGTRAGEPHVKHIVNTDLWELRPLQDRVFFFQWNGEYFVLLHHFVKKSRKTPPREIEQALRNMRDYIERSGNGE